MSSGREPAFPSDGYIDDRTGERWNCASGMTLRDYFAAKAMQGLLAANSVEIRDKDYKESASRIAYAIADAMLKAREA